MKKIPTGLIIPSAAFCLQKSAIAGYQMLEKSPEPGDLVFGSIRRIGQHSSLENVSGRIHAVHNGSKAVFVFGNRYAPDHYEGVVQEDLVKDVDLLARSGMIGSVITKNAMLKDPTRIRIQGYLVDKNGKVLNTRDFSKIKANPCKKGKAKLVLVIGTAMNSGKSLAAAACCRALHQMGYVVNGCKMTGTASLKDILHMNDAGAKDFADFTYLGYPSTYKLSRDEMLHVFHALDSKLGSNSKNYLVVEFADGINQRETAMLLESPEIVSRVHKLIFCAADALGAVGGIHVLKTKFNLVPDAISGVCSSSPLHIRELNSFTEAPVFNGADLKLDQMAEILLN
jgi:hypothetical protein